MLRPRRGLIVALVGVDGSGKSSAAEALAADARFAVMGVKRMYFGSNGYRIPGVLRMNASLDAFPVLRYLPRALMSLDRQSRLIPALYHRSRGRLVVCDRYYHDDMVARHVARQAGIHQSRLRRAASAFKAFFRPRMLFRPDHTFYLDVSASTAYGRKQDYAFALMVKLNSSYRELMSAIPDVTFIDAEQPRDEVHESVASVLQDVMIWRARTTQGSGARMRHFAGRHLAAFCLATPSLRSLGARVLSVSGWWHPSVDMTVSQVQEILAGLDRDNGRGMLRLTGTGSLHHASGAWVRMTSLGSVSDAALSSAYRNWRRLADSEYADLVDYRFIREKVGPVPVYAVEQLHELGCDSTATDKVLDRLRGTFVENQFRDMPFGEIVGELSITMGLTPEQARSLTVRPESGFHGLVHGDLHLGNLARNASGRIVMIDLDRVHQGAQVLDLVHAVVVAIETDTRRHWLSFFSSDIGRWPGGAPVPLRAVSRNSLTAYFLWRQAMERAGLRAAQRAYLRRLRRCCERLISSHERRHDDADSHHIRPGSGSTLPPT